MFNRELRFAVELTKSVGAKTDTMSTNWRRAEAEVSPTSQKAAA
jgi:hypothetical protein